MTEPRRVSHYAEFLDVIRSRVAQLGITHETLDAVAGLQSGYASKLLCDPPIKRLGPITLFLVLDALGLQTSIEQNTEALKRVQRRLEKRIRPRVLASTKHTNPFCFLPDFVRIRGSKGGHTRAEKLSPRRRRAIAKKAANARWSAVR